MAYMTIAQESRAQRIKLFKHEIAEQQFHDEPCPLLLTQLEECLVLTKRLEKNIREQIDSLKHHRSS